MTLFAMMMPGPTEMIVIGVIAVLLFGRKLPKLAFDAGNSFTMFKKGLKEPIDECGALLKEEAAELTTTVTKEREELVGVAEKEREAIVAAAK